MINENSECKYTFSKYNKAGTYFNSLRPLIVAIFILMITSSCAASAEINNVPEAKIISITPDPAEKGESISFTGYGNDTDGYITDFKWVSSIDGLLSRNQNFTSSSLSHGTHEIYFLVCDEQGEWSADIGQLVIDIISITVDDTGNPDYTSIQDAVNAATPGDTILVYPGTYHENIYVNKQVTIQSTDGDAATNVTALAPYDVFYISADGVNITGLNISGATGPDMAGINLDYSNNCTISNNKLTGNYHGVYLGESGNNKLVDNNFSDNKRNGLVLSYYSDRNTINSNTFMQNRYSGIYISESGNNILFGNIVSQNEDSGILLESASDNLVYSNLINNTVNTEFSGDGNSNVWNSSTKGNYWAKPDGSGFSQVTDDADNDSICDSIHTLSENNVDYLPLAQHDIGTEETISIASSVIFEKYSDSVPVKLSGITDTTGCSFDLGYDPLVVVIDEISHNSSFSGMSITSEVDNDNGKATIQFTCIEPLTLSSAVPVIFINFNATGQHNESTSLELSGVELTDEDFNPYTPEKVIDGTILVRIKGDFNNNGRVDIADVTKVAYMVVGKEPQNLDADFNNNGRVEIGDSTKIAYYLVGKVDRL